MHFFSESALIFINTTDLVNVTWPIFWCVMLLSSGSPRERCIVLRDLGVPIGLILSLIGMVTFVENIMTEVDDVAAEVVYPVSGLMLTPVFYGGLISIIGYFISRPPDVVDSRVPASKYGLWRLAFVLVNFALAVLYGIFAFVGAERFYQPDAFAVCLLMMCFALIAGPRGRKLAYLSRALLASGLLSVLSGIIFMFMGDLVTGVSIAGVGLIVGLVGYVFVYIIALAWHITAEINAPLTNWHWIEVTAFYFFLFLAPDTMLDNLQERAVQQQIQELQSEIAILKGDEP